MYEGKNFMNPFEKAYKKHKLEKKENKISNR